MISKKKFKPNRSNSIWNTITYLNVRFSKTIKKISKISIEGPNYTVQPIVCKYSNSNSNSIGIITKYTI